MKINEKNKNLIIGLILVFGIILAVLTSSFVTATSISHGYDLSISTGNFNADQKIGWKIKPWGDTNLHSVTKKSSAISNFNTIVLRSTCSGTDLAKATFVDDVAVFTPDYSLTRGTNYYLLINQTVNATYKAEYTNSATYPVILSNTSISSQNWVNVTNRVDELCDEYTNAFGMGLLSLDVSEGGKIRLNAPAENYVTTFNTITFNISYNNTIGTLKNVSIFDNSTGGWVLRVTNSTPITNNNSILNFTYSAGNIKWTAQVCYTNHTCDIANTNRTFSILSFTENSQTFNNVTFSLQNEQFKLNITYDSSIYTSLSGFLWYNNTQHSGSITYPSANTAIFTTNLIVPQATQQINKSFVWQMALQESGGSITYRNATTYNQTINPLLIDDCSSGATRLLNYTIFDEDSQNYLNLSNGTSSNGSMAINVRLYPATSSSSYLEYSVNKTNINPVYICSSANFTNSTIYYLTSQVQYSSGDRVTRFNNIQNLTLRNTTIPINVPLYDLLNSRSQIFKITFKDKNFLYLANAIIDVSRKYISQGVFLTVESPLTDYSGQASVHLIPDTTLYTFTVKQNNQILATYENMYANCQNPSITECKIDLNQLSSTSDIQDYNKYKNLYYSMTFNRTTRIASTTFSTVDGSTSNINMNVTQYGSNGNVSICSQSITTSSGVLTCNVPTTYGNSSIVVNLYSNGNFIASSFFDLSQLPQDIFGYTGTIMVILMFMTLVLIMISSSVGIIVGAMIGIVLAIILNLVASGSLLGVASTFVWFLIACAIILWKITQRGGG